ncbi:PREDICTED: esterase E4-like [Polistes canadensis]|uniref:esterase E4-like n=1 Tax=Polistes canadensis TaxID=91411 RepID=UPI000718B6BA|nr:PREDICTED: esterase E4-like [Polistes canadensis]
MSKTSGIVVVALSTFFVLAIANDSTTNEGIIVNAPVGKIRGTILTSRLGKEIYSFRNVIYAEPPVGEKRFKAPIPVKDWDGIYDGTQEGPACSTLSDTPISEDCLRLNVYTTKIPTNNAKGKHFKGRPVIVYFHPGGFYYFSGQYRFYGPEYMLDKDVVLVTLNFRLGSLGFLATGDSYAPGNAGYKDQVVALRWVQRNIAAFGGDPNSVTIGGTSVGAISVLLHMISPMSKGLFHRGIAMSGSFVGTGPYTQDQKDLAIKQAEFLNCPTSTTKSMIDCLRSKPIESYTKTISRFFELSIGYPDPMGIWGAVIEPEIDGSERFLTGQPIDLIREGKINEVPLIIGTTAEEFGGQVVAIDEKVRNGNNSVFDLLNNDWDTVAPISLMYERGTSRSKYISDELRKFYFGNQPIGRNSYDNIAHIYSDRVIVFPVLRAAKLYSENSKLPVYFYRFSFSGRYSFAMWNNTTPYKKPVHHDDQQYLFTMNAIFPFYNGSDPEVPMIERSTAIWSNFAHTGEPIPRNNELFKNVVWDRFETSKDNYLDINLNPTMKQGIFPERMALWERLFPLPPQTCTSDINDRTKS